MMNLGSIFLLLVASLMSKEGMGEGSDANAANLRVRGTKSLGKATIQQTRELQRTVAYEFVMTAEYYFDFDYYHKDMIPEDLDVSDLVRLNQAFYNRIIGDQFPHSFVRATSTLLDKKLAQDIFYHAHVFPILHLNFTTTLIFTLDTDTSKKEVVLDACSNFESDDYIENFVKAAEPLEIFAFVSNAIINVEFPPTQAPSASPTSISETPSLPPTNSPTSKSPSSRPTVEPSSMPTGQPTASPSLAPSSSGAPSTSESPSVSNAPSISGAPSLSNSPSLSDMPTPETMNMNPSDVPSFVPSSIPSVIPSSIGIPVPVYDISIFNIDVTQDDISSFIQPAIDDVTNVVVGDLSSVVINPTTDPTCIQVSQNIIIDDLAICFQYNNNLGNGVLGLAGPRRIRSTNFLPYIGRVQLAQERLSLETDPFKQFVTRHEILHVLGVGTLWDQTQFGFDFVADNNTTDCTLRPSTKAAEFFQDLTGCPEGTPVPLEPNICAHWDTGCFQAGELMEPTASNSFNQKFSQFSAAVLEDFGYTIDYGEVQFITSADGFSDSCKCTASGLAPSKEWHRERRISDEALARAIAAGKQYLAEEKRIHQELSGGSEQDDGSIFVGDKIVTVFIRDGDEVYDVVVTD